MCAKLFILNTTSQLLSPFKADLQDNNFVFILLVFIISLSLISQFYSKASPVHKVIALLLLSVLAVFLWTHETQFLFIYLVYILAFVGAVLILFLSVVLILPISTTSSVSSFMLLVSDIQPYNKYDLVSLRPASLSSSSNYSVVDSILSHKLSITLLFIIFIFIYHAIFKLVDDMILNESNFKVWLEQFSFVLTARCSGENLTSFFSRNVVVTNPLLKVWGQTDLNNDTPFRFLNQESQLLAFFSQFSKGSASVLERVLNQLAVIGTIIYGFFRYAVYASAHQLTLGLFSKGSYSMISNLFTKHLVECFVSLYLAINLFILVVPSITSILIEGSLLVDTNFSGLSELRSLLYDHFGWFLLLSTAVLLVALLGVAVMTRNKK